ncbi:MAG: hypothetical protein ACTJHC_00005 [Vagococcus sp.]
MKKKLSYIDFKLLIPYIILNIIGIMMIFSASSYNLTQQGRSSISFAFKQSIFFAISLVIIGLIYHSKLSIYKSA